MTLQIDDAFIKNWEPQYDEESIGGDYKDYGTLVRAVAGEMNIMGTISKKTFLEIWKWKGAMRVIRHVRLAKYENLYAEAFRRAASEPPERKLAQLVGAEAKLPGVGTPTGSTIIHSIHPDSMAIIDIRTVETLFEARRISTKQRDLEHYEEFRKAINRM